MDERHLTEPEVDRTVAALMSRHPAFSAHERFITDRLQELAHRAYQHGASQALLSLSTTSDVAAILDVSVAWVRRLAARHGIGWRADRDWVFRPDDVEQLRLLIGNNPGPKSQERGQYSGPE